MHTFNPVKHRQFYYCQDVNSFQKERFAYYLNAKPVTHEAIIDLFLKDSASGKLVSPLKQLTTIQERVTKINPDVFIMTATKDRERNLRELFQSIKKQRFNGTVFWLLIENGSSDGTVKQLKNWSKEFPWVSFLCYHSPFGYATPARNRGLAMIQLATRFGNKPQFVWNIDSDDLLHNEYSLYELYKSALTENVMTHGFSVCRYENSQGELITVNTIPRDIGSGFPKVKSLKDEFEMGPQILSSLIPTKMIPYLYYPDEFTMEDDTLNQRIMVWSRLKSLPINTVDFPCLTKTFHFNSMSGTNDQVGNGQIQVKLGPKIVTGIRAQAVLGLHKLRDFYTREGI